MCNDPDIRFIDGILEAWKGVLGKDFQGYRNHAIRVAGLCLLLHPCDGDAKRKFLIAACYHDIGNWADRTFDYIDPSVREAVAYLRGRNLESWSDEIGGMVSGHHKLRRSAGGLDLIEVFRQADLIDLSLGLFRFGIPGSVLRELRAKYPNRGFHNSLLALAAAWFLKYPGNPFPMVKW
jgi:hypothetical protein